MAEAEDAPTKVDELDRYIFGRSQGEDQSLPLHVPQPSGRLVHS